MPVELTRRDEFAIITLNRPEALNALSFAIIGEIGRRIDEAAASDARCLLIVGAGPKAFCAGADIAELMENDMPGQRDGAALGQRTFAKLDALKIPSVAVINGFAFGGGLELAMACTLRVATPNAKMGQPEIRLGLIPGYGGTQRLPRLIGQGAAMDMILTGRTIDAAEAHRLGLVNRVIDGDALDGAIAYAREFCGFSLPVLRFARDAVLRSGDVTLDEGLKLEADLSALAMRTADAKEGTDAFLQKRNPQFRDG